jgi:hypothetical protein
MSTWIFQGVPSRYDVALKLQEEKKEVWLATRFREEMAIGDVVYFWRAGEQDKRGLYGWGVIAGEPKYHEGWGWGVPVRYIRRFPQHLAAQELSSDPVFGNHLLFRMAAGTNFEVTEAQARALERLVGRRFGASYTAPEGGSR